MTSSTTAKPGPRLSPDRYLELLTADGERLAAVAEGHLDEPVPTCPGWDVAEVVRHTGSVYHHKVACIRLGRRPEDGEWAAAPPGGTDLLDWYRGALGAILTELRERPADSPAFSWYPPEQDVAFWQRRMAQETVVHRVDAETGSGQVTAAEHDLAVDGIDEFFGLIPFWRGASQLPGSGESIHLHCTDGAGEWLARLGADGVIVTREHAKGDAALRASASDLMLFLYGRRDASAGEVFGDRALLDRWQQLVSW